MVFLEKKYLLVHKTRFNIWESFKFINFQLQRPKWRHFFVKQFKRQLKLDYYTRKYYIGFRTKKKSLNIKPKSRRKPRKKIRLKLKIYKYKLFRFFYGFLKLQKIKNYQFKFIKSFNRFYLKERFFKKIEKKLDYFLYKIGFFKNTLDSHDYIIHGYIYINYKKIYNKNYHININDIITVDKTIKQMIIKSIYKKLRYYQFFDRYINLYFFFKPYLETNYKLLESIFFRDIKYFEIKYTLPKNFLKINILATKNVNF